MKIIRNILLTGVAVMLFVSCSTPLVSLKYRYSVAIINEGTERIGMLPFAFTGDWKSDSALMAEVGPNGGSYVASPYLEKPIKEVFLRWKNIRTGIESTAFVRIDLPKQFTRKNGSEIRFIIHSDEGRVEVKYRVQDPVSLDKVFVE